jgi:hypothetical protein
MPEFPESEPAHTDTPVPLPAGKSWFQRLTSVLFIIFCFELGLFLLIYPWTDGWSDNYFAWLIHGPSQAAWHAFWDNSYVRGGLSGIGIANLWIAIMEVFHMFTRPQTPRT